MRYVPDNNAPRDPEQLAEYLDRELWRISRAATEQYDKEPVWDDLRFPSADLKSGTSGVPSWNNTYGLQEFDVGDYLFATVQLPHGWKEPSDMEPHIHWMKITSAAGNVNWQIEYRWIKIGEVMDGSWTTLSSETPYVSDGDTAWQHALTPLGTMTVDGSEQISDMLQIKVSRVAAAGTEYGTRAALLEFDIHLQLDSHGSVKEYIKV